MDNFDKHFKVKGPEASQLRRRKYELVRKHGLPEPLLAGSLTWTNRRCGKATCHCASGNGHPRWVHTFTLDGHRHTETVPTRWVEVLRALLSASKAHRNAVAETLRLNTRLFQLWRQQERSHRSTARRKS